MLHIRFHVQHWSLSTLRLWHRPLSRNLRNWASGIGHRSAVGLLCLNSYTCICNLLETLRLWTCPKIQMRSNSLILIIPFYFHIRLTCGENLLNLAASLFDPNAFCGVILLTFIALLAVLFSSGIRSSLTTLTRGGAIIATMVMSSEGWLERLVICQSLTVRWPRVALTGGREYLPKPTWVFVCLPSEVSDNTMLCLVSGHSPPGHLP